MVVSGVATSMCPQLRSFGYISTDKPRVVICGLATFSKDSTAKLLSLRSVIYEPLCRRRWSSACVCSERCKGGVLQFFHITAPSVIVSESTTPFPRKLRLRCFFYLVTLVITETFLLVSSLRPPHPRHSGLGNLHTGHRRETRAREETNPLPPLRMFRAI